MSILDIIKRSLVSRSVNKDVARKTFILNILLVGAIFLAFVAFVRNCILAITTGSIYYSLTPPITFAFLLFLIILFVLSKKGRVVFAAIIFTSFLFISAFYTALQWGADVPQAWLMFALIIIISGILVNTRFAFYTTLVISTGIIVISILQLDTHMLKIVTDWKKEQYTLSDTIVRVATLIVIGIVSWLFNREIEKSLKRARESEAALRKQRDTLEVMVEERTNELQLAQAEKLTQIYKFAEFGRMASGLFHDLANPLGLVSLNLDILNEKSKKLNQQEIQTLLHRAISGAKQLENFVITARKQMQNQDVMQTISLNNEIEQAIYFLAHKAKKANVIIQFDTKESIRTFGNPIKFIQCATNLLSNAIDAYDNVTSKQKIVKIDLRQVNKQIVFTVSDWGEGISPEHMKHVFNPLFTTKSYQKGTGMGLTICKDVIEKDFSGTITMTSTPQKGTTLTITIPQKKTPTGTVKQLQN